MNEDEEFEEEEEGEEGRDLEGEDEFEEGGRGVFVFVCCVSASLYAFPSVSLSQHHGRGAALCFELICLVHHVMRTGWALIYLQTRESSPGSDNVRGQDR